MPFKTLRYYVTFFAGKNVNWLYFQIKVHWKNSIYFYEVKYTKLDFGLIKNLSQQGQSAFPKVHKQHNTRLYSL